MTNIASLMRAQADEHPAKVATRSQRLVLTYDELRDWSKRVAGVHDADVFLVLVRTDDRLELRRFDSAEVERLTFLG